MSEDQRIGLEPSWASEVDREALPNHRASALKTERQIARLRIFGAVVALGTGIPGILTGVLPIVFPGWLFLSAEAFLLIYAVVYAVWEPYRKFALLTCTRAVTILDLGMSAVFVLNLGGVRSPFWAIFPTVALFYTIRFGSTRLETLTATAFLLGTAVLAHQLEPGASLAFTAIVTLGIGAIMLIVAQGGMILTRREHQALKRAFNAEYRVMARMVNTVQHEVNNPLAVATGNLELIRKQNLLKREARYIDRIEEALRRIDDAVGQMRQIADDPSVSGRGSLERYTVADAEPDGGEPGQN
jgi:signal transduction histidine kinase